MTSNRLAILPVVLLTIGLLPAGDCRASEPQVTFAVKNRWVSLTLTHDGAPVNEARIKVFDGSGQPFASGETGSDGRGEFPLPRGSSFTVEIKVGERTADMIRLTPGSAGLFPSEVLLSFGLAPCCRVPSRGWSASSALVQTSAPSAAPTTSPTPTSNWLLVAGVGGILLFMFVVTLLILFRG